MGLNILIVDDSAMMRAIAAAARWKALLRVIISTDGSEARRHEVWDLDVRLSVEKPFRPEVMRDVLSTISTADTHVH